MRQLLQVGYSTRARDLKRSGQIQEGKESCSRVRDAGRHEEDGCWTAI